MGLKQGEIPSNVRDSEILTGHDLERLSKIKKLPSPNKIQKFAREPEISAILEFFPDNPDEQLAELHKLAKAFINDGELEKAWLTLLQC